MTSKKSHGSAGGGGAKAKKVVPALPTAAAKLVLPPGYTRQAANSTAKRYSRGLSRVLGLGRGEQVEFDEAQREMLEAANLGAVWLGHATVLLRMNGRWILTDPVFSHRVGVHLGPLALGVQRLMPAFAPGSLPKPDIILLSHAHFDHLDVPSLRALRDKKTQVITAVRTKGLVPRGFGKVIEAGWRDPVMIDDLRVTPIMPAHWGARTILDKRRGFNSYLVDLVDHALRGAKGPAGAESASTGSRVLYAGDTAHSRSYDKVGPIDLTIFGIGAYDPWIHAHASPEQVWDMHTSAQGEYLLPMHHSTFKLSDEPMDEPLARLIAAAGKDHAKIVGREVGRAWVG
ncbi:MAG: MBL fold metallo-hydrolase [Phycisphaerales bacterium]